MIDVNAIIKDKLKEKGLSVKKLAESIDVNYSNLNKTLNGKSGMNLDTFLRIADVLGLDITDTGTTSPVSDIVKELEEVKEDNRNLKTLASMLRRENEELKGRLGE